MSLDSSGGRHRGASGLRTAARLSRLPAAVQRYLNHAMAGGGRLPSAIRLRMHGEIKLRDWCRFEADQVIRSDRGMIWRATVRWHRLPIRGFDRVVDGVGAMQWKLLGVIPVVTASGPDVTRSATDRLHAESIWLPSLLCDDDVAWDASHDELIHARLTAWGRAGELWLTISDNGGLKTVRLAEWGNPDGGPFRAVDFGAVVEEEATFGRYTIPTRLRVGWHFNGVQFGNEGEFFRVTVGRIRAVSINRHAVLGSRRLGMPPTVALLTRTCFAELHYVCRRPRPLMTASTPAAPPLAASNFTATERLARLNAVFGSRGSRSQLTALRRRWAGEDDRASRPQWARPQESN